MVNDRQITISVGASRKSVDWKPQRLLISELWARLKLPVRGTETQAAYLAMKKGQQDELKDVGGYVAGQLTGGRRKAGAVIGRDIITLDLDSIPAGGTAAVTSRVDSLGCGFCVYSTRKHMPSAPRLRILLPLDRTCSADEYEPIARRMAEMIGIEYADPSTFEASRLMYWPSCSADAEYIYLTADKPMLSVDGLLATYADWRNTLSWPTVPGAPTVARLAAKQEDPTAKTGVVGAFCRVYNIEAAMEAFLPGVYTPVDGSPGRYTYTGGSTTGGAVLYDNGAFLYSHHATDPCSGRLVNSFDLVRLHKFGDLDDEAVPGTPTVRLPSYTKMQETAKADPSVLQLMQAESLEEARTAFQAVKEKTYEYDGNNLKKTLHNLQTCLQIEPELAGLIGFNLFSGRIEVTGALPWPRATESPVWSDTDAAQLRIHLEKFFHSKVSKQDVLDTVDAVAGAKAFHPVRDWLNGLEWDGVPRLDTLFVDYLGAADTPYTRAVTRKSLVAAVARVMTPGCKYDTMLVLVGDQGRHKSSILAKLGGEWFSDSLRTFGDKDSMETIQGTWINEVAEMQAMAKTEVDAVKMFLSKTSDYYRAAYGRYAADRPRQCVFFGTTNSRECLTDLTGGRRFWVVDIDVQQRTKNVFADLDAEREQVWAEAVMWWRMGETLHLPPELEQTARAVQEEHRQRNSWEGLIEGFLEEKVPEDWPTWDAQKRANWKAGGLLYDGELVPRQRVCALEIWCELLGEQRGRLASRTSRDIIQILEKTPGWDRRGVRFAGEPYGKQLCFERANGYVGQK